MNNINNLNNQEEDENIDNEFNLQPQVQLPKLEQEEDELDDDFPEYANEQNKQLNQIIKEKRRLNKDIVLRLEELQERVKVLSEHYKNVKAELLHTQALIDAKNKEIESEDHLKQITERQNGRLESELRKLDKLAIEQQERLNDIQNQIFKGNEKMDQFKLEMNWNQEELEQWALAARQKEEDNITLEKYKRADEAKIKELNLQIERLTVEVSRKQNELEKEITETQAVQIELDKTAEEFKRHHEERHKLFQQWQEVTDNLKRRDQSIVEQGENFAKIKMEIKLNEQTLEERQKFLQKQKQENKNLELAITTGERRIVEERAQNKKIEENINNLEAEVEILKNQLSAFATELSQKKNKCSIMQQNLLAKKQRLNNAQKKYNAQEIKLKNEDLLAQDFKKAKEYAEEKYKQLEKEKIDLEKLIRQQKDNQFKQQQKLFDLREKEANLYGEIQGTMAASRNLQSHINRLNQEFQRQQELLYNAEYQIQLMERKVSRAQGERTIEETKELNNEIKRKEIDREEIIKDYKLLQNSLKKLDDDLRAVERNLTNNQGEKKRYVSLIEELTLENDMTWQDLNKIIKQKEEILVRHDCMKLEIKKIQETLNHSTDQVFSLENKKYQLEMSMQEREKEINVHKDVLIAEHKASEEARHKIAQELADRKNKVKNLKIKYESLVQKNKATNGEIESVNDHTQAYYIIKAAQEREELQRKGDELNAAILKSEKELKALDNTLNHLKTRNSNYRDSFLNKGITQEDYQYKDALEEQCKAASKNLFGMQKELQKIQKELDEDQQRLSEINNKVEIMNNQHNEIKNQMNKCQKELIDQQSMFKRAEKALETRENNVKQLKINLTLENPHIVQMQYDIELNKNSVLIKTLMNLAVEYPELGGLLNEVLQEKNINLPTRPPSSIDMGSLKSVKSYGSQQSRGSRK